MTYLILLIDPKATAFTDDAHVVAVIKLMRAKEQLIIGQLVCAADVVALESNLVHVLLLDLVDWLQYSILRALAWRSEKLRAFRPLPLLDARGAEVCLTGTTLSALYHDVVAECALQGFSQVCLAEL